MPARRREAKERFSRGLEKMKLSGEAGRETLKQAQNETPEQRIERLTLYVIDLAEAVQGLDSRMRNIEQALGANR